MALEGVIRGISEFVQRLPVRFYLGNLNLCQTPEIEFAISESRLLCLTIARSLRPTHTKLLSWFRRA